MGGFFLRPKDTNKASNGHITAEAIGVVEAYEDEYMPTTGFNSSTDGLSGAVHRRDPERREAPPGSPLPGGSWRSGGTTRVASGFGKGTRAGKTGVR